jgi:rhomboid protease GluP
MKSFPLKFRHIFIPFLLVAAGFMIVYSLLNVWLSIQAQRIPLKEDTTDLWLPLTLPAIPLWIWLRSRIKILNLNTKKRNSDLAFLYFAVATVAIGIPAHLLQSYLRDAMGELTPLSSISQIREARPTRYYRVNHYYIDTAGAAFKNTSTVSGKNNEYLNYTISIACPMYDGANSHDTTVNEGTTIPSAWICINYKEQISNRLESAVRKEKWKAFFTESEEDFRSRNLAAFNYLDRIGYTDDREHYRAAIEKNSGFSSLPAPLFILVPEKGAFEARTGNQLTWVFGSFGIFLFVLLIMLAIPKLSGRVVKKAGGVDLKEIGQMLLPRKGYLATPIIIDVNILIFLLMMFSGLGFVNFQGADLLPWGANYRPLTAGAHQWWRLLTCTFVHVGVFHLLFNMFGLLFAGLYLEPVIGTGRMAIVYLLTGIVASLTSLWWHPAAVGVGASGAIFGVLGTLLALLSTKFFAPVVKKILVVMVAVFVGVNLIMGLANGVDNAAHIGGLLSGIIAGYLLYPQLKKAKTEQEAMV